MHCPHTRPGLFGTPIHNNAHKNCNVCGYVSPWRKRKESK